MSNQKLDRVNQNIQKTKTKISGLQKKLREYEAEKVKLEDEQIITAVRSERVSDAELTRLIESFKKGK